MALAISASELAAEAARGQLLEPGPLTAAQLAGCAITQADFEAAVKKVQPSVRREGFATTPDVTWADVGSLTEVSSAVQGSSRLGRVHSSWKCHDALKASGHLLGWLDSRIAVLCPLPCLLCYLAACHTISAWLGFQRCQHALPWDMV